MVLSIEYSEELRKYEDGSGDSTSGDTKNEVPYKCGMHNLQADNMEKSSPATRICCRDMFIGTPNITLIFIFFTINPSSTLKSQKPTCVTTQLPPSLALSSSAESDCVLAIV